MKTKTKIILLLLFLSPILAELLSNSSPPLVFFNPPVFLTMILLYGCGTLLIREAKARWKLQWSIIFLAAALGILVEGTIVQSFFNLGHLDLGILSGYGMYFGVQWPWTINLILYHATISVLIPIAIIELLWPKYKYVPLLKKRGLLLSFAGVILVTLFFLTLIFAGGLKENLAYKNYEASPLLVISSIIAIALLIWLSWKYRQRRVLTNRKLFSPFIFAVAGFLYIPMSLVASAFLAHAQVPALITIFIQLVVIILILLFAFYQISNRNITKRHIVSLIFGSLLFWIILTPLHELGLTENPDPTQGMLVVGIISLILLIIWRNVILRKNKKV
jgi:hypothetical protein